MPKKIDREELKQKIDSGEDFVLIEVLGKKAYEKTHIRGAVNVPLKDIGHIAKERYDPETEIVVYCADVECQASPKAAQKLEGMGFHKVYVYAKGKKDWMEAGYDMESGS